MAKPATTRAHILQLASQPVDLVLLIAETALDGVIEGFKKRSHLSHVVGVAEVDLLLQVIQLGLEPLLFHYEASHPLLETNQLVLDVIAVVHDVLRQAVRPLLLPHERIFEGLFFFLLPAVEVLQCLCQGHVAFNDLNRIWGTSLPTSNCMLLGLLNMMSLARNGPLLLPKFRL